MKQRQTSRASLTPNVIGGSVKLNADNMLGADNSRDFEGNADYEFVEPVNACGCVRNSVWKFTIPFTLLFFLFQGLYIGYKVSVLSALAVLSLVVACVGCNLLCCPCCQPAKGVDE